MTEPTQEELIQQGEKTSQEIYHDEVIYCEETSTFMSIAKCMHFPNCTCSAYLQQVSVWEKAEEEEVESLYGE